MVREPLPDAEVGLSFYFEVNGIPVFARGASIVPFDALDVRVTDIYLRQMLTSAQEANFNAFRVWGGGDYLRNSFWDMADEFGFLVWLDFQFATALYPRDAAFVSNVVSEVTHQARRLTGHASHALWCGGNEVVIDTHRMSTNLTLQQVELCIWC
jgi:beta-mannosidase